MSTSSGLELGYVYGHGDLDLVLFGSSLIGFESVEWKKSQKKEHIFGKGRDNRGVGRGNIEYTGSIEILYDELIKIIDNAPNGNITDIPPFSFTVWFGATTLQPVRRVILANCEFMESPFKASQGETSIKMTLPLLIGSITYAI